MNQFELIIEDSCTFFLLPNVNLVGKTSRLGSNIFHHKGLFGGNNHAIFFNSEYSGKNYVDGVAYHL